MTLACDSLTFGSGANREDAALAVVDLMPFLLWCMCPKMVGIDAGRSRLTRSVVRPGKEA